MVKRVLLVAGLALLLLVVPAATAATVNSFEIRDADQVLPPNVVVDDENDGAETVRFVFTVSSDVTRTDCRIDSLPTNRCESGFLRNVVGHGVHTATVIPKSGGRLGTPSTVSFEICPASGCAPPPPPAQCADGADNDGDGQVDLADPGCVDASDNDETDPPPPPPAQCADGVDNDGDGFVDLADPGCVDAADNDETNAPPPPPAQCADGADNDGDSLVDLADPGCVDAADNDETDPPPPPPPSGHPYTGPYLANAQLAPLDPNSTAYISEWLGNSPSPNFSKDSWGVAIADSSNEDPLLTFQTVSTSCPSSGSRTAASRAHRIADEDEAVAGVQIHVRAGTRATPVCNDGHLSIWNRDTNRVHDFYDADFAGGLIRAQGGMTSIPGTDGYPALPNFWGPNAANMPLRAGLITPEDLADADGNGRIDHALVFSNRYIGLGDTSNGRNGARYPAAWNAPTCSSDPDGCGNNIPEGTWLRLNPTYPVELLNATPYQKMIARTLQHHGMFLRDNGGTLAVYGATLYAENGRSESEWQAVGVPSGAPSLSMLPWADMQVLEPPPLP